MEATEGNIFLITDGQYMRYWGAREMREFHTGFHDMQICEEAKRCKSN
jgi:hypothetical protein